MGRHPEILVIGSGVIGMTTALCLSEAGFRIRLVTGEPPLKTTSAMAGALWGPWAVDDPRVLDWSLDTLESLRTMWHDPTTGVALVRGSEASRVDMRPPAWLHAFPDFTLRSAEEVPTGYSMGWAYSAPILDMPRYLGHLEYRLRQRGVTVDMLSAPFRSLDEVAGLAPVVVNCTGLGSREFVPDPSVRPSWGLLVTIENPGIDGFFSDYPESEKPTYYIAHRDHVVLGGFIADEVPPDHQHSEIADDIFRRCSDVRPELHGAGIVSIKPGLRPSRPRVRLEREIKNDTVIIHNYGHGGSGVTLSWGCARGVRQLLDGQII